MERREAIEAAVAHLPLMLTVEQARQVLGIGRSLAYAEVRRYLATDGREGIPAVRIGSAIRIPRAGLVDLMLSAPASDLHAVVWIGQGADLLGLVGEVDDKAFLAVMAGMDPRQPSRHLGRRYDDASVRGFEVTGSAPKSVSILWAPRSTAGSWSGISWDESHERTIMGEALTRVYCNGGRLHQPHGSGRLHRLSSLAPP